MFLSLYILLSVLTPTRSDQADIPVYTFREFAPYLHQQSDTTYVINFWATWCKPCVQELPYFDELEQVYAGKKIKVLLVSLDFSEKKDSHVIPFLKKKKVQSEVVILDDQDVNSWIAQVDPSWSGSIPATLIYNQNERHFYEQSFSRQELQAILNTIVK